MTLRADDNDNEYVIFYGYEKTCPQHTAYLRLGSLKELSSYYVEDLEDYATHFKLNRRGWTPVKLSKFLADEDELQEWKFHAVVKHFKSKDKKDEEDYDESI